MPGPRPALACAISALVLAAGASPAAALVTPAQLVDGPSAAIREFGGVAMSADGTGGLVYRKDDGGRPHIYAAQFVGGAWQKPQRVDTGPTQGFESSWPVIAAGDGGRLLVVWVQEFGASDRLFSATLQPGSRRFEPPVPIDLNIGDSALGTWPSVSMAPGGQAYLVYRVITDAQPATAPPGSVLGEYRLARYTGQFWSGFGVPANRNLAAPQPVPGVGNRPQIATDQLGNAVVAWQELDDGLLPRIYARRVFPTSTGIAVQVSPQQPAGLPLLGGADRFSLDVSSFGAAVIAWRQAPPPSGGPGSFARNRVFAAQSGDEYSATASTFSAPRPVDAPGPEGPAGDLSSVRVAAADPGFLAVFGVDASANAVDGDDQSVQNPVRLDDGTPGSAADPVADLGGSGAAALAWKVNAGRRGSVVVRERRSDGVVTDRTLAGPSGGGVDALDLAGSGVGDALVGFTQGVDQGRQVVAGVVDAPPDVFNVQTPIDWTRASRVPLQWDAAGHAIGGVSYDLVVDDDTVAQGLKGTSTLLRTADLADGSRTVTIVATDDAGQETTSVSAQLKLDTRPPRLRLSRVGRRVTLKLVDGRRGQVSGVAAADTVVQFGDGARAAARTTTSHRFRAPGRYRVSVVARDQAGNRARIRRTVVVP